ncbi:MAG: BolA/IbaG family iron-sulfur metabolism protein [Pseudomonadota bacterium]|nr:BolA/IbaG family iron-sulfur metabolism protein [Pseudomonadota bacterium]
MVTAQDIHRYIEEQLPCTFIEVRGEDGQHFEAVIVSERFRGLSMIAQHQMVYKALGERMKAEIHALSMQTFTPEVWALRQSHN